MIRKYSKKSINYVLLINIIIIVELLYPALWLLFWFFLTGVLWYFIWSILIVCICIFSIINITFFSNKNSLKNNFTSLFVLIYCVFSIVGGIIFLNWKIFVFQTPPGSLDYLWFSTFSIIFRENNPNSIFIEILIHFRILGFYNYYQYAILCFIQFVISLIVFLFLIKFKSHQ